MDFKNNQLLLIFCGLSIIYVLYLFFASNVESFEAMDTQTENRNLRLMVKYLTLILKRHDAEKELYRLAQGHSQVYHSPRIDVLDKQIYQMKKVIKEDPKTLNFFKLNLDLVIV